MRQRIILPSFLRSISMSRVSLPARFLFIMLWLLADDHGRLRGAAMYILGEVFSLDKQYTAWEIDGWLRELQREECIDIYSYGGLTYIVIVNWKKYQHVQHPSPSQLPGHTGGGGPQRSLKLELRRTRH
jgi:hypothetical protein